MTVLVSGATGTTGGAVLAQLREADVPVRAMTRNPQSAQKLSGQGVEAVVADLAQPDSLPKALEGVEVVYVANPASPQLAEHERTLALAAVEAGVGHLVKLSVIGASADSPLEFGRVHAAAEQAIKDSGIAWTMIRPNGFMQNTLAWAAQIPGGTIRGPVMDARWSIVDVRDVAAVAVAALRALQEHAAREHTVTGATASSPREQVAVVADVIGKPLDAEEVPIEAAVAQLGQFGVDEWTAQRLGELWRLYAEGQAEGVAPDFEQVTGRAPRSFEKFAADHRSAFAGD